MQVHFVLLAFVAVLLVLFSRGGSNFTDPGGDKIGASERFTRSGILYTASDPGPCAEVYQGYGAGGVFIDRAHGPKGVSTMEWGTRTAIDTYRKLHNRVPDVVYDLGAVGKSLIFIIIPRISAAVGCAGATFDSR